MECVQELRSSQRKEGEVLLRAGLEPLCESPSSIILPSREVPRGAQVTLTWFEKDVHMGRGACWNQQMLHPCLTTCADSIASVGPRAVSCIVIWPAASNSARFDAPQLRRNPAHHAHPQHRASTSPPTKKETAWSLRICCFASLLSRG
jgi:hypothetical protein